LTDPTAIKEFAVHVPSSYDYRFITDRRDAIIELLKRIWFNIKGENMPLYHIPKPKKDLQDFTTTEKDMKTFSLFKTLVVHQPSRWPVWICPRIAPTSLSKTWKIK
jgi:hypothetical protein